MRQLHLYRATASLVLVVGLLAACGGSPDDTITPTATEESASFAVDSMAPEPTPEPTPKPLAVKVTKVSKSVAAGNSASVTIKTKKGAKCSISVEYESGESEAKGLGDKKADANGKVTWKWAVGKAANAGDVPVTVWCSLGDLEGSAATSFTVK